MEVNEEGSHVAPLYGQPRRTLRISCRAGFKNSEARKDVMLAQGQRLVRPGLVQFDVRVSLAIIKWPIVPCFRSQAANRLEDLTACFSFGRQFNNHVTSILKAPIIKVD